jgi:copper resistance protein B
MRTLALLLAATALAISPAAAQHAGHNMPMPSKPAAKKAPAKKPAAKKPAPKKKAAKKPAAKKAAAKKAAAKKAPAKKPVAKKPASTPGEKGGHDMHAMPGMETPSHQMPAGPQPEAQSVGPNEGHGMHAAPGTEMPAEPSPHASHEMGQMAAPEPQPAPPPPEALTGPEWAADAYWRGQPKSRQVLTGEHGAAPVGRFLIDRAESRFREGRDGYLVDIQAWYGGDIDKLWLKSEVEGDWGKKLEHAEVQALWSHAIGPWFDLQAGVRYDPQPGPNRSHLVLGVEGLAPYWWEVEGAVFLSNKGDITARAEGEYDLLITQKLVLQPRGELNFALQDIPELAIGSGLTDAELGLRLRYQFSPLFAPYIGVEYEHAFGDTRDFRRAEGGKADGFNLLAGVRLWF